MKVRGQLAGLEPLTAARTALVIIDMQNYFLAEGQPGEVPPARGVVDTVNSLAAQMREQGVLVVWVQTDASDAAKLWPRHHDTVLTPERARRRVIGMSPGSEGFALYPGMRPAAQDWRVTKVHYSAFIEGSSELDARLRERGIDTVLIAGTATNVCCDSSARDASMLGLRVIMVADAMATWTDGEHAAALDLFGTFFGDVMNAHAVCAQLRGSAAPPDGPSKANAGRGAGTP